MFFMQILYIFYIFYYHPLMLSLSLSHDFPSLLSFKRLINVETNWSIGMKKKKKIPATTHLVTELDLAHPVNRPSIVDRCHSLLSTAISCILLHVKFDSFYILIQYCLLSYIVMFNVFVAQLILFYCNIYITN